MSVQARRHGPYLRCGKRKTNIMNLLESMFLTVLAAGMALAPPVGADQTPKGTLSQMLEAVESNPELAVKRARGDAARANQEVLESFKSPKISVTADGDLISSDDEEQVVEASIEQTIHDWGALDADLREADLKIRAEDAELAALARRVRQQVVNAYVAGMRFSNLVAALDLAIGDVSKIEEVMSRRVNQNVSSATDLLLVRARLSQYRSSRIQAEGNLRDSHLQLIQLTGLMPQEDMSLNCNADFDERAMVQLAIDNSADVQAERLRVESIVAKQEGLASRQLPSIVGGVGFTENLDTSAGGSRAFISVRYDYDVGNRYQAELATLKAEVAEAKFEEERLIQSIVRESAGLINTHRVEQSRSDILTEMIGIRDDQLASMSRKFNAGQVTLIELMNVQQDLSDARAASVDSDAASCSAILNLEQMTGRGLRAAR